MKVTRVRDTATSPELTADAAFVLALAHHALAFADSTTAEAERWLRIMRVYGQAGATLQALGVGEAPLDDGAARTLVPLPRRPRRDPRDAVRLVERRACALAVFRQADVVSTVDLMFALGEVYGDAFDRELRIRGASWQELVERLPLRRVAA